MLLEPTTFLARISEQAQLCPVQVGRWQGFLSRFRGRNVEVTVAPERKQRSHSQNAYFHGIVVPCIAAWSGMSLEETKTALKWRFLKRTVVLPTGEEVEYTPSTAKLTVEEFSKFLEECIAWSSQAGNPVPQSEVA
jgi:hypothetical protein